MQDSNESAGSADHPSPFAYDRVAYRGTADPSIQLRNLEVTAAMYGARPAEISRCRVLEIGCADGTNLLPFALEFPESQFVGIDLAKDRIRVANQIADEAAIKNVEFRCVSVVDLDAAIGSFDYILCPGVFSWVTDEERQAILRVCRECLATDGLAVISYNTLPGWNWSGTLREFIRQSVQSIEEPEQQIAVARNAIEFLAANTPANTIHGAYYARAFDRLRGSRDAYLYHDYITDRNQPFYFHEFAKLAIASELQFVGEADFKHSSGFGLEMSGRAAVVQTPPEHREQLLDFLLNTNYRSSIVCHADCQLAPRVQHEWIGELHLALADPMVGFTFDASSPESLTLPFDNGAVTVTDIFVKAALRKLMDQWPDTTNLDAIYQAAMDSCTSSNHSIDEPTTLARTMLAFYGTGLLKAFKTPPRSFDTVSDQPQATPLVRLAAARGLEIVNQWHQPIEGLSSDARFILTRLDGTRDIDALVSEYQQFRRNRSEQPELPQVFVDESLRKFAQQLLLIG